MPSLQHWQGTLQATGLHFTELARYTAGYRSALYRTGTVHCRLPVCTLQHWHGTLHATGLHFTALARYTAGCRSAIYSTGTVHCMLPVCTLQHWHGTLQATGLHFTALARYTAGYRSARGTRLPEGGCLQRRLEAGVHNIETCAPVPTELVFICRVVIYDPGYLSKCSI
jgi:hypothetical protein